MSRPPTRRPDDTTGVRLLNAGIELLRTGTAIEDLRLTDAVAKASEDGQGTITIGAAYPRFPGRQAEFRLAVLARWLELDHARHRDQALNVLAEELGPLEDPLPAGAVPALIEAVAGAQDEAIRNDPALALRLYATCRVADGDPKSTSRVRDELRRRDEDLNLAWSNSIKVMCQSLEIKPRPGFLYGDFEIFASSLLTGLALRSRTSGVPEGLYGKLILSAAYGFFEGAEAKPSHGIGPAFAGLLRRVTRRKLNKTRILDAVKHVVSTS